MKKKVDMRKIINWLAFLAFQPTIIGDQSVGGALEELSVAAEVRQIEWADSEGVYGLMNQCYDKAKGSFSELARDLGYTNLVESVFLSYDEGRTKMKVSDKEYVSVSLEQMRRYLGQK
jgi:hypothetical protein